MIKFLNTDIVFREIPSEVSLAFNITNCTHKCIGCHSPDLRKDIGTELNDSVLIRHIKINNGITCVLFLGGLYKDIISLVKKVSNIFPEIKWAWYTGDNYIDMTDLSLDYIKTGEYIEDLGPINIKGSNQKLYKKIDHEYVDVTSLLQK